MKSKIGDILESLHNKSTEVVVIDEGWYQANIVDDAQLGPDFKKGQVIYVKKDDKLKDVWVLYAEGKTRKLSTEQAKASLSTIKVGTDATPVANSKEIESNYQATLKETENKKPPKWVADNDKWQKARAIVKDRYGKTEDDGEDFWKVVTGIYKKMKGRIYKSTNESGEAVAVDIASDGPAQEMYYPYRISTLAEYLAQFGYKRNIIVNADGSMSTKFTIGRDNNQANYKDLKVVANPSGYLVIYGEEGEPYYTDKSADIVDYVKNLFGSTVKEGYIYDMALMDNSDIDNVLTAVFVDSTDPSKYPSDIKTKYFNSFEVLVGRYSSFEDLVKDVADAGAIVYKITWPMEYLWGKIYRILYYVGASISKYPDEISFWMINPTGFPGTVGTVLNRLTVPSLASDTALNKYRNAMIRLAERYSGKRRTIISDMLKAYMTKESPDMSVTYTDIERVFSDLERTIGCTDLFR